MPYDPRLAMMLDMLEAQQRRSVPKYSKGGKIVDLLLGPASTASTKSRRKAIGLDTKVPEAVPTPMLPDIPMSRRDVLRVGAGQTARGMIPQGALGSLKALTGESMPSVSNALNEAIDQITSKPAFRPSPSSDAGRMAAALYEIAGRTKKGSPDFGAGNLKKLYNAEVDLDDFTYDNSMSEFSDTLALLSNPKRHIGEMMDYTEPEDLLTQGDVLALGIPRDLYSRDFYPGTSMMNFKDLLRVMRQNDPKRYDDLKTFIRDIELGGGED